MRRRQYSLIECEKDTFLHRAVRSRDVGVVEKALDLRNHVFINNLDDQSKTPIQVAIEEQLDSIVDLLVSRARERINDNQYLIHYAIEKGNIIIVKLLAQHFSIEQRNQNNVTPFCTAVLKGKFEILDYLLSLRNNVDTSSNSYNDCAVFYLAVIAGNTEIVKKFLESNFPINSSIERSADGWYILNDHAGFSPLHLAVKYLRLNIVELLLNGGADVSKKNESGSTALHLAFEAKIKGIWNTWQDFEINNKIIDTMIGDKLSDSVQPTNQNGISHLHIACSRDKPEMIENLLREKSISVDDLANVDHQGFSALHYAAKYRCPGVAKVLLRYKVNVNQIDKEFCTPLHIASRQKSVEFVQVLMQHGADLTLKDSHGSTPIHVAFNESNYDVLDSLFTHGSITNSNPTDSAGISHFHIACTRNDINLVRGFINAGVYVDLQVPKSILNINYTKYNEDLDWRGCGPLHFAAAFNRSKIVELLLMHGADVHRKNANGFSPIHVACQQNYDRFGNYITENLYISKNDKFTPMMEFMSGQIQNRPLTDVILVDEDTKITSNSHPRRFPNISSQVDVPNNSTDVAILIDWDEHKQEQIEIIKMLFEHGADLNAVDGFGNAPLYYIYDFNIHKILDVLDEKLYLDTELVNLVVMDLLKEMYTRRMCLLKEIFNFGVYIKVDKSFNNTSILHYVCQKNEFYDTEKVKMLKYFLKKNADPDAIDALMRTPLHTAVEKSDLYRFETNVSNHENPFEDPPFRSRESQDHEEMIVALLNHSARVDFPNYEGQTPLFSACLMQKYLAMSTLLRRGADVNVEDYNGKTAVNCFFEVHMQTLVFGSQIDKDVFVLGILLVQHVQSLKAAALRVSDKVDDPTSRMNAFFSNIPEYNDLDYLAELGKQVENLKNAKISNQISLYDVLFMDEHRLCRDVIIEQLEKILGSEKSCIDTPRHYFHMINHKYRVAVERKRLLSEAKPTLNRLLSTNFPEVCSDFIFMSLENFEIAYFVKAFAIDESELILKKTKKLGHN